MSRIAVVGMACRYPDAGSPQELWENVLAGRRAFRRLPDERTRLADYWAPEPTAPDRFHASQAAVIEGYRFDRVAFTVAGSTYRATDLTHWLALDVAARALGDAGFPDGDGLPRERTGVVVGNTLTGEFSRANLLRLRWPYVRRTVAAQLRAEGWDDDRLSAFLAGLERRYKQPFPPIDEDSLAGGLSNTIAGRICNHFDLKGGGYTVDGACSSSLLSVVTACRSLLSGELAVAVAGGVDLSIDPFELVGFAKAGALATGEMRVYDRDSNGFWPGEGCGMVVLMREADARAAGHRVYATIAGWGVSSDGKGGITRPELAGYQLALRRAYQRTGFDITTVGLFEGHGTGTAVGDATELAALSEARRAADPAAPPAAIGSVKAMIGHTKAAAGVAGLIKATLAVHHEVLPATVGCVNPHPVLTGGRPALRVLTTAESWPAGVPVRAGVTAMGFGGINTHVVLERPGPRRRRHLDARTRALARAAGAGGGELLLVDADRPGELRDRLDRLAALAGALSYAEVGDLAVTLHRRLRDRPYRAAVVAGSPADAARRLARVRDLLDAGRDRVLDPGEGVFAGRAGRTARIGYLFPGQGSGRGTSGGALRRRFPEADEVYRHAGLPVDGDGVATSVAQPRIVTGSLAGVRVLASLGIEATVAVGHSLGEISALHWAGSLDEPTTLRVAALRGQIMAATGEPGTMAGLSGPPERVEPLLAGEPVVVAGYNGPSQTVVAGPVPAVKRVCARAASVGLDWALLPVSHAFHSPLMAAAAAGFADRLADAPVGPVSRRVVSTVTGAVLGPDTDVRELLRRQVTEPVRFAQALATAADEVELLVEVGPGRVLTRLAGTLTDTPVVPLDTDSETLAPVLAVVAAGFVLGAPVAPAALFADRPDRPLAEDAVLSFFVNPCELAPEPDLSAAPAATSGAGAATTAAAVPVVDPAPAVPVVDPATRPPGEAAAGSAAPAGDRRPPDPVGLLRRLVAARAELPAEAVRDDSRLLDDLHLSSITVGQILGQAARELGLPAAQAPTNVATATLRELATMLAELGETHRDGDHDRPSPVAGVDAWVRPFRVDLVTTPAPARPGTEPDGDWRVYAPDGHPLAEPLRAALSRAGVGGGVLVCLPPACQEADLALALTAAQAAAAGPPGGRFVVVQHGRGAAGIARTLRLEAPGVRTTIVDTPPVPAAVDRVVAEVAATTGFAEVCHDLSGTRRVPLLRPLSPRPGGSVLGADDVLLVTGGGKGITAECALALAVDSGVRLAVLGRSDPAGDPELAANLARMAEAGVTVRYARADVTDPAAVRSAVADLTRALGPVTAVMHGAGRNEPAGLAGLDPEAFRRTLAPKLAGLRAVLDAVAPERLRLLVTFGSIIGRAGLRGEAHYATANDWLAHATAEFAAEHPGCRTLCLEWSVWSGTGMGERLSVVESLLRDGVTPIPPDRGVEVLRQLLADPATPPVVVVTGRADHLDTIRYDRPALPLLRFVEHPVVHYPGVELVADTDLTPGTDLYLDDHVLDGNRLFPAVIGLEAMAQAAVALRGRGGVPVVERAEFPRPVVVPRDGATTVRVAALATGDDTIEVVVRSSETGFAADHFRATLRFDERGRGGDPADPPPVPPPTGDTGGTGGAGGDAGLPPVPLDPGRDLYGGILFQGKRFQRLLRYRRVAARRAEADVAVGDVGWFGAFLPGELVLGDPGMRDALMHGIQVCVPDATLLPIGVDRVHPVGPGAADPGELTFVATERSQDGVTYVYDLTVRTPAGAVVERWEGLRLRAVRHTDGRGPWPPPLLGPFLQRRLRERFGVAVEVAVEPDAGAARRGGTAVALGRVLGGRPRVRYRPDGRPFVTGGRTVSASHGARVTLAVAGDAPVGCDVEPVVARTATQWTDLLGRYAPLAAMVAAEAGDPPDLAATRVWCALECLRKLGEPPGQPLTVVDRPVAGAPDDGRPDGRPDAGWVALGAGAARVVTFATRLRGVAEPVVLAVAVKGGR
jgi:enediyne polyketide synthase